MYFNSIIAAQILAFASVAFAAPQVSTSELIIKQNCTITTVEPPPKQLICQQTGILTDRDNAVTTTATESNKSDCLAACKAIDECLAFSIDASTKVCQFFGKTIKDQNFHAEVNSNLEYSNKNCFIEHCSGDDTTSTVTLNHVSTVASTFTKDGTTVTKDGTTVTKDASTVTVHDGTTAAADSTGKVGKTTVATLSVPIVIPTGFPILSTIFSLTTKIPKDGIPTVLSVPVRTVTVTVTDQATTLKTVTKSGDKSVGVPSLSLHSLSLPPAKSASSASAKSLSLGLPSLSSLSVPHKSASSASAKSLSLGLPSLSLGLPTLGGGGKATASKSAHSLSLPLTSIALPTGTELPLTSVIGGVTTVVGGVTSVIGGVTTVLGGGGALPTGTELPLTSVIGGVTTVVHGVTSVIGGVTTVLSGVALPTDTDLPLTSVIGGVTSILGGGGAHHTGSAGGLSLTSVALPTITSLPVSLPLTVSQSLGLTESLSLSVGPVSLSLGTGDTISLGASGLPLSLTVANPVPSVSLPILGGLNAAPAQATAA